MASVLPKHIAKLTLAYSVNPYTKRYSIRLAKARNICNEFNIKLTNQIKVTFCGRPNLQQQKPVGEYKTFLSVEEPANLKISSTRKPEYYLRCT